MIEILSWYLGIGIVVGIVEHYRWPEMETGPHETINLFLRVMTAWPTYLIEDFMFWLERPVENNACPDCGKPKIECDHGEWS